MKPKGRTLAFPGVAEPHAQAPRRPRFRLPLNTPALVRAIEQLRTMTFDDVELATSVARAVAQTPQER